MDAIADRAAASGLRLHGLRRYHLGAERVSGLVVGFGVAGPSELARAMQLLGDLLRSG